MKVHLKILDRYILKDLIVSFLFTLTIFTFVLFTGTLFKIIQLFIGKISLLFVVKFFLFSVPYLLSYAMPLAFLTATLLVFGHLSAESEITAMKACGVSMLRIIIGPVVMSVILTMICLLINDIVLPFCHYELRLLKKEISTKSPASLMEPGVVIDHFDGYKIYIDETDGDKMKNISIQQKVEGSYPRFIKAEKGLFEVDVEQKKLILRLYDVLLEQQQKENDNTGESSFIHARMGVVPIELRLDSDYTGGRKARRRTKDYTIGQLWHQKKELEKQIQKSDRFATEIKRKRVSKILTAINTRLSLAFSCLGLLFIGVALGIRTHRSEKTVGIPISLSLFAVHYGFTLFGKALSEKPAFHPEIIVWLPNIFLFMIGSFLLYKIACR